LGKTTADETVSQAQLQAQRPQEINRSIASYNREFHDYYIELQRYGVPRVISRRLFAGVVAYAIQNAGEYRGTIDQKAAQILQDLCRDNSLIFSTLRRYRVPADRINEIITDVIRIVLIRIGEVPASVTNWSNWNKTE
jgi:hypothetical protein